MLRSAGQGVRRAIGYPSCTTTPTIRLCWARVVADEPIFIGVFEYSARERRGNARDRAIKSPLGRARVAAACTLVAAKAIRLCRKPLDSVNQAVLQLWSTWHTVSRVGVR